MARLIGPDEGSREVRGTAGVFLVALPNKPVTIYADPAGEVLADILTDPGGAPIAGSVVYTDEYSMLPLFQFPDGVDTLYARYGDGPVWRIYARTDDRLDQTLKLTGGNLTGSVTLESSFAGGEDEGQPGQFDSTSRLNLESYQRADFNSYGEVLRIYSRRADSKQMIAWYGPRSFDPVTREPLGNDYPWFWMGAHYEANDHGSVHGHWSCEVPDTTGALQTRLEMPIWDPTTGVYGMDKVIIKTNAADFNVRCSNGQELRLSAPIGQAKAITFSTDSNGGDAFRRWRIQTTNDPEPGTGSGSNFSISRYSDAGTLIDTPIFASRGNGRVGIGVSDPTTALDVAGDRVRIRTARTPATATATGNQGDIAWDANFIYVCVATNQWKRAALASW